MTAYTNKDLLEKKLKEYELLKDAPMAEKYIKLLEIEMIARCLVNEK